MSPRRLLCLFLGASLLTCGRDETEVFFLRGDGEPVAEHMEWPDSSTLRALPHPSRPTKLATTLDKQGLRIGDRENKSEVFFRGSAVAEVERDPGSEDVIVGFLSNNSRFGIIREGVAETKATGRVPRDFLLLDYDGDGRTDIVGLDWYGDVFVMYDYLSAESLDGASSVIGSVVPPPSEGFNTDRPRLVDAFDFDDDGRLDVVALGGDGVARIFLGAGSVLVLLELTRFVVAANLDGTAGEELVSYVDDGEGVVFRWTGSAAEVSHRFTRPVLGATSMLEVGDVTSDGLDDLVLGDSDSERFLLLASDGTAPSAPLDIGLAAGIRISSVAIGDFDGDGTSELAAAQIPQPGGCY